MISEILRRHLRVKHDDHERPTHDGLHVSDVSNGCSRQVWHRLHNGIKSAFGDATLRKMRMGVLWEDEIRAACLLDESGIEILGPEAVVFPSEAREDPTVNAGVFDAADYDPNPKAIASPTDLVGHPDIVIELEDNRVMPWEIKTTMLFRSGSGAPAHPTADELSAPTGSKSSRNYVLQNAAYARAYGAEKFGIYVLDRGTGAEGEYVFETAPWWDEFRARWTRMMPALDPSQEAPVELPAWTRNARGTSYLCKSCPVLTCSNNPNSQ